MELYSLTSGSKANSFLIVCDEYKILIDVGSTKKYLSNSLASLNYTISDIDLVLITHLHSDHIRSVNIFNEQIIFGCNDNYQMLDINKENYFKDIIVHPFILSHDSNCTGYQIKYNNKVLTYITDTGYIKDEYIPLVKDSNYLVLEFNHDIVMLNNTNRPHYLKKRILSDKGHLNNLDASLFLVQVTENLEQLVCAHISNEANHVDLIEKQILKVFNDYDKEITFKIDYAKQLEIVGIN